MSSLLRKFKVTRCPLDGEVLRVRAFETHMKKKHRMHPNLALLTKRALKEDSCLICSRHTPPKIELMASTRKGNDYFIKQHASHLPKKLAPLAPIEKEAIRQILNSVDTVDLDLTPQPQPHNIPTPQEVIGVIEENSANGEEEEEEEVVNPQRRIQDIFSGNTPVFSLSSVFSDIPQNESPIPTTLDDIATLLHLPEGDPQRQEAEAAHGLNEAYQKIYQPGLHYPRTDDAAQATLDTQIPALNQTVQNPSVAIQTTENEQNTSRMTPIKSMQDASLNAQPEMKESSTSPMENIPILTLGLDHIREVNAMKNVMIKQIMQDNIDLLESKLQSRKRALHALGQLFETRTQQQPMSDDVTVELSRIIHLKNKLIEQLLKETASLHPQVYNVMTHN